MKKILLLIFICLIFPKTVYGIEASGRDGLVDWKIEGDVLTLSGDDAVLGYGPNREWSMRGYKDDSIIVQN